MLRIRAGAEGEEMNRTIWVGGALIAAAAAVFFGWRMIGGGDAAAPGGFQIETAEMERRDLARVVAATGAIAPLVTVEVGSQLSGQILEINADFNDPVTEGQVIARIDPQTFATRVREAEAALEVAESQVAVSEANLARAEAEKREAERALARAESLLERQFFSEAAYDSALTANEAADAAVLVARANLRNARAALQQRQASLESARVDLERTIIRSPIDGVVIDRQIDVGQTVAASFNAPVLFLIAQDLSRVQIEAQVDEADIGQIEVGQTATFEVDAFPDAEFAGTVRQVRLAADTAQNVVTYTVVIEAENRGQRLLPGMTANAAIETGRAEGALAAPNAALRFEPRGAAERLVVEGEGAPQRGGRGGGQGGGAMLDRLAEQLELTEEQREQAQTALREAFSSLRGQAQAGGPPPDFRAIMRRALSPILTEEQRARLDEVLEGGGERPRTGTLWVETGDGRLEARPVRLGLSDGQFTEVLGEGFEAGDAVVTRVREAQ